MEGILPSQMKMNPLPLFGEKATICIDNYSYIHPIDRMGWLCAIQRNASRERGRTRGMVGRRTECYRALFSHCNAFVATFRCFFLDNMRPGVVVAGEKGGRDSAFEIPRPVRRMRAEVIFRGSRQ
jgi:hypothetical protein